MKDAINTAYKHSELTGKIIGCAMKVHSELGNGFQEIIYQRCLDIEMAKQGLVFARELEMTIFYDGIEVGKRRVDFLVADIIMVEIKATSKLEDPHLAQVINYLEAYKLETGLLLNFGSKSLEFKRITNEHKLAKQQGNNQSQNNKRYCTTAKHQRNQLHQSNLRSIQLCSSITADMVSTSSLFWRCFLFMPLWAIVAEAILEVKRSSSISMGTSGKFFLRMVTKPFTCTADCEGVLSICLGSPTIKRSTCSVCR